MCAKGHRAVFLDRDGTINVEKEYLWKVEDFDFIPGVTEAIRRLNEAGYLVVIVTNQSGVARGYFTLADVDRLHQHIKTELEASGATIQGFYVCPHHPEKGLDEYRRKCDCRKGAPGLLIKAAVDLGIDLKSSFMVGDKIADIEAAERSGCTPLLVLTGYGKDEQHKLVKGQARVCDDLTAAVELILAQ